MQRVVIAIQPVQKRRLGVGLDLNRSIRSLPFWWRVVLRSWTLGTPPVALANEEAAAGDTGVHLARLYVYKVSLRLEHSTGATLVVDTDDLLAGFEVAAGGGGWEGLEELDLPLAVDNARVVEFGDTGDLNSFALLVVVDYFLGILLEGCDGSMIGAVGSSSGTYEG